MEEKANLSNQDSRGIICRTDNRGKILDFRDNLWPAYEYEYQQVHGLGGEKHARRSGIRAFATDYSGEETINVYVNLPEHIFKVIENIALENIGTRTAIPGTGLLDQLLFSSKWMQNFLQATTNLLDSAHKACGHFYKGKKAEGISTFGEAVKTAREEIDTPFSDQNMDIVVHRNWRKAEYRVNSYKADSNDFCPVSYALIERNSYRGNSIAKNPWTVTLCTFTAKCIRNKNGTTTYDRNTIVDGSMKKVEVTLPDEEMFRLAHRVNRYVELWEQATAISLIRKDMSEKLKEFNDKKEEKK